MAHTKEEGTKNCKLGQNWSIDKLVKWKKKTGKTVHKLYRLLMKSMRKCLFPFFFLCLVFYVYSLDIRELMHDDKMCHMVHIRTNTKTHHRILRRTTASNPRTNKHSSKELNVCFELNFLYFVSFSHIHSQSSPHGVRAFWATHSNKNGCCIQHWTCSIESYSMQFPLITFITWV